MDAYNAQCPSSNVSADTIDEPYRFGRRPTVRHPFPFTDRQFARLLVLRSRYEIMSGDDAVELAA